MDPDEVENLKKDIEELLIKTLHKLLQKPKFEKKVYLIHIKQKAEMELRTIAAFEEQIYGNLEFV